MKNELYSASSCAVENYQDGLRVSMDCMHLGEYNSAQQHILKNPDLFRLDKSHPKMGGTCSGSKLVVLIRRDFAQAAAEELGAYHIRREIAYVNGARTRCDTIADAVQMALNHS